MEPWAVDINSITMTPADVRVGADSPYLFPPALSSLFQSLEGFQDGLLDFMYSIKCHDSDNWVVQGLPLLCI